MAFRIRISWKIPLGLLLALLLAGFATRGYWFRVLAQSLVFSGSANKSDVIFIENSDFKYLLFERAARLSKAGMGRRVIIPVETDGDSDAPGLVSLRVAEVMCQVAQIIDPEFVAIKQKEPYSIGMARQLAARLQSEKVRSAIIVTQAFRSRRTYLIYHSILSPLGIEVSCSPVFGGASPENWTKTWHGVQDVVVQLPKLQ